jgi:hypothetical protein
MPDTRSPIDSGRTAAVSSTLATPLLCNEFLEHVTGINQYASFSFYAERSFLNTEIESTFEKIILRLSIMAAKLSEANLQLLKTFIDACKANSALLHTSELKFFKDWLIR